MRSKTIKIFLLTALAILSTVVAQAQRENGYIREGNEEYKNGNYKAAEVHYRSALQINSESQVAISNLASALFRQGLFSDAEAMWGRSAQLLAADSTKLEEISHALYNLGNAQLSQRQQDQGKLDAAIESYKQSLRLNPRFDSARYNLAYAQALKQDGDGGGGGGNDNQDQQDQQDQQNKDNQQNKDQNKDDQQDKGDKDQKEQQSEAQKPQSRADAEKMADAIQRAEDRTKQKVDEKREGEAVGRSSGKSW